MKRIKTLGEPPRSEVVQAVAISARLGHTLLVVARRNGISQNEAWGMLAEHVDTVAEREFRRGYRTGRLSTMPHLVKEAA